jgi:hypothetical protein
MLLKQYTQIVESCFLFIEEERKKQRSKTPSIKTIAKAAKMFNITIEKIKKIGDWHELNKTLQ